MKTALDVLNEKYDIISNLKKLHKYVFHEHIIDNRFTLIGFFNGFIKRWKFNRTFCENVQEMISVATNSLKIESLLPTDLNNEAIFTNVKNYLEIVRNILNTINVGKYENVIIIDGDKFNCFEDYDFLNDLLADIIKRLLLREKEIDDWITLYKDDVLLDVALPTLKPSVQEQVIKYQFETDLIEKKKILIFMATELHIEKKKEYYPTLNKNQILFHYLDNATTMLNNLNLRHPNDIIPKIDKNELGKLYDALYYDVLMVHLISHNEHNEKVIEDYRKSQKADKK